MSRDFYESYENNYKLLISLCNFFVKNTLTNAVEFVNDKSTMENHQIWVRIDELMRAKNLDMPTLADKSGLTRQSLYNLKRKGRANTETIRAIAAALDVGAGYLMG